MRRVRRNGDRDSGPVYAGHDVGLPLLGKHEAADSGNADCDSNGGERYNHGFNGTFGDDLHNRITLLVLVKHEGPDSGNAARDGDGA